MDMQRHASAAPLLKTPLPTRTADTTATNTGGALGVMCQIVLRLPPEVRADGPGQRGRPLGAGTGMQAWGHRTTEPGEQTIQSMNTDKVGLPSLDRASPVLKEG